MKSPPGDPFDAIWMPRIGEAATARLRRDQHWRWGKLIIAAGGTIAGPAFVWSLGGPAGLLLGILCWMSAIAVAVVTVRRKSGIAAEVSNFYGRRIRGGDLPIMNAASFDRWAAKKGLRN